MSDKPVQHNVSPTKPLSTTSTPVTVASVTTPSPFPLPFLNDSTRSDETTQSATTITTTTEPSSFPTNKESEPRVFCVEDDERLTPAQHMACGAFAGMAEHMAMFPIDTVKTRMQSYVAVRDLAGWGMIRTTRAIVSTEGLGALWRGVGAVAVSAGPAHALYFATYEAVRAAIWTGDERSAPAWVTATGGVSATIVADGIMTPLDVVKQRMQLGSSKIYESVWSCAKHVYKNHGLRAFFAGYKATLVMNVPFTAVYFTGYEAAKNGILEARNIGEEEFSVSSHCLAGGIAGATAAACTNPLDVVKTRLQTQGEIGARRYRGLTDALTRIRIEEGITGLMRGVKARVLFHMPAAAVCWTTYEFCKHLLKTAGVDISEQRKSN